MISALGTSPDNRYFLTSYLLVNGSLHTIGVLV